MGNNGYVMAEDPSVDLEIAEVMIEELEDYLVGDELYRTVIARTSAGDRNLNMCGGDLLSRIGRLQGERDVLTEDEGRRLDALVERTEEIIYSLQTRFLARLNHELKARLDSLRWFLDDCAEDMGKCRSEYPFEMRNRQRIEELVNRLGDAASPALLTSLANADRRLLQYTKPSPFIWDERLEKIYPNDKYWYLYRQP